jgi:hypothetical protein
MHKRIYDDVVQERDILGTQLIRRNDELALLYEKIRIQQTILSKGVFIISAYSTVCASFHGLISVPATFHDMFRQGLPQIVSLYIYICNHSTMQRRDLRVGEVQYRHKLNDIRQLQLELTKLKRLLQIRSHEVCPSAAFMHSDLHILDPHFDVYPVPIAYFQF